MYCTSGCNFLYPQNLGRTPGVLEIKVSFIFVMCAFPASEDVECDGSMAADGAHVSDTRRRTEEQDSSVST
jgi:hypothetical protein